VAALQLKTLVKTYDQQTTLWVTPFSLDPFFPFSFFLARSRTTLYAVWALSLCSAVAGMSANFGVQGTITFSQPRRPEQADRVAAFSLRVGGDKWFIRLDPRTEQGFDYVEAGSDGSTVYCVTHMETSANREMARRPELKATLSTSTAWVCRGQILHVPTIDCVNPAWLAYASGAYFRSRTNHMTEPVILHNVGGVDYDNTSDFLQQTEWSLNDAFPFSPRRVVYLSDGLIRVRGKTLGARPPPYDAGYTNAVFEVVAFTNAAGVSIPLVATLTVYSPGDGQLEVNHEYVIRTIGVDVAASEGRYLPELPARCVVSDARAQDEVGVVVYKSSGRGWPTLQRLKSSAAYGHARDRTAVETLPPEPRRRAIAMAALALTALVGPLLLIWRKQVLKRRTR
jgi:hypothetical protein